MAKTGWGAAKEGKVISEKSESFGEYKESNVQSSRDLNGLYAEYQGKTLTGSK